MLSQTLNPEKSEPGFHKEDRLIAARLSLRIPAAERRRKPALTAVTFPDYFPVPLRPGAR